VDVDQDGDLDVQISNRGNAGGGGIGEPNRFYTNLGGMQGGTVGHYLEDTNRSYGDLISVAFADQVHGNDKGPFRDFSCDCDFADLDDDGDLDMFHSSYGPGINGTRNSLIFLNDGMGVFHELWPWADPAADIKTHTFDMDLADLDDDFDIDIAMSSRDSQARIYLNNLYGPPGAEPFRDVTQQALIDSGATLSGSNNYELEIGDMDGDGDFDLWTVNYDRNNDRLLENQGLIGGAPRFEKRPEWLVGDPNVDDNEADFGDFDGDGDLDVFMANFSGTNWLYLSGVAQGLDPLTQGIYHRTGGGGSLASGFPELPTTGNGQTSLDADWGDMDGDGDLDILVANDGNGQNRYFENTLGLPDTHAPGFHAVSAVMDPPAGAEVVIHASVRDNAPYYLHAYYAGRLVYDVDGGGPVTVPMVAQGGHQFRGVIPPQVGSVAYHVEVDDLAGNTGVSATLGYAQGSTEPWTDLGFSLGGLSGVPSLLGTGTLVPGSPGTLTLSNAAPSATAFLFVSLASTPTPFKGGTLVPVPVALTLPLVTNGTGSIPLSWTSWPGGLPSGTSIYLQYAIADAGAPAGTALSNALKGVTP
jgi:hypothetical protein